MNNTVENNKNPWACAFVESFTVAGNSPPGLEQCMENGYSLLIENLDENIDAILSQGFLVDLEASVASAAGADRESLEQLDKRCPVVS